MSNPSLSPLGAEKTDHMDLMRLLPLFALVCLHAAGAGAVMPVLPFHLRELGASPLVFGLVLGAEGVSQFLSAPLLGRLSDQLGRKSVILLSQLLAAASLLLLALSQSLIMVFAARLLFGCTTGSLSAAIAYASEHSGGRKRRQAIGFINAAVGLGAILGAGVSSLLSEIALSAPIWLAVLFCACGALLSFLFLRESPKPAAAAQTGTAAAPPLSLVEIFRLPVIRILILAMLCHFFAYGMYGAQLPNYLAEHITWNGQLIGAREFSYLVMADGLVGIVTQIFVLGWLGRWLNERQMMLFIAALISTGFFCAALASSLPQLLPALFCVSMADALAKPTYIAALTQYVPPERQGAVIGAGQALVALADISAPVLAGAILLSGQPWLWIAACIAVALGGAMIALLRLPAQDKTA